MKQILLTYLKPYYPRMGVGFLIKFVGTIIDLFIPYILAYIIDTIIPSKQHEAVIFWGVTMVAFSFLAVALNIIANRMASRVARDAAKEVRHDLFSKVMHLSAQQTDAFTKPSLISRLTTDTYNFHQMVGMAQRMGVRAPIMLTGGIIVTFTMDRPMALVMLAVLPLLALTIIRVSKKSIVLFDNLQEAVDRFVRMVREDIAGIRVIKALSRTDYETERFRTINREVIGKERKAGMLMAALNPSMNMLLHLGMVGVIILGAFRVHAGTSEVGKILAFTTYFTIMLNTMMMMSWMFQIISKAIASGNRIKMVLDADQDFDIRDLEDEGIDQEAVIIFENVTFSYGGEEPNLSNINFTIRRGETLGIIGEIGSGKSTIINLLMRIYDVDEGRVLVAGRDVRTYSPNDLKAKFGVVFQNDTIFEDTISGNVTLGRELTEEEVQEALFYARASDFIEDKDEKEEENLNIKGANLSGGQKQRVLIARAMAAKPPILILDDSSSALDYKTDAALRKGIRENFKDTTLVIVAQRVSSVRGADHILVLEDGCMIGYGTHEELMEQCEIYREIGKSQMGGLEVDTE